MLKVYPYKDGDTQVYISHDLHELLQEADAWKALLFDEAAHAMAEVGNNMLPIAVITDNGNMVTGLSQVHELDHPHFTHEILFQCVKGETVKIEDEELINRFQI